MKQSWYHWEALSLDHGVQYGLCKAQSLSNARHKLLRERLIVRKLTKLPQAHKSGRRKSQRILTFLKHWQELLEAGIDQHAAWGYLHQASADQTMAETTAHIQQQLAQGDTLQVALHNKAAFPSTLSLWVGIGEQTGRLPEVLSHLYSTLSKQFEEAEATRIALRYPLTVFVLAVFMLIGMVTFLLPRFADVFAQLNTPLPALTQSVMKLNDQRVLQGLLGSLLVFFALFFWIQSHWNHWLQQPAMAERLYRLPWLGIYWRSTHLVRDLHMLILALNSHVPLQQACLYTAKFSASAVWRRHWTQTAEQLNQGHTLTRTQRQSNLPSELIQAIQIGEQSGRLANQLVYATQQLQRALANAREQRLSLLPTGVLIGVSAITLVVLLSLYLPLFQLGQTLG